MLLKEFKEKVSSPHINPLPTIFWLNYMSLYQWMSGRPADGLEMVKNGLQLAQKTGLNYWKVFFHSQAVYCALTAGEHESAREYLKKMTAELPDTRRLDVSHYYLIKGYEALLRDDLRQSLEDAEMGLKLAQNCGSPFPIALNHILISEIKFEIGYGKQALEHLNEAYKTIELMGSNILRFKYLLVRTHFAMELGRVDEGRSYLQELLQLGQAMGYVNAVGWRPKVMARICRHALEADIEVKYVRDMIKLRKLEPAPQDIPLDNWPYPIKI